MAWPVIYDEAARMVPAANSPWPWWNSMYATASSTTGNLSPWPAWNIAYTNGTTTAVPVYSTTATTLAVPSWESWNTTYTLAVMNRPAPAPVLTPAEQVARDAAMAERIRQADTRRAQQRATRARANARAEELLASLLSKEQLRTYREHGWFEVRGSAGGRWRIRADGQAGNVDLMPETGNEREASFCCHPPDQLPDADAHVAQMLHLVTDEDGFRKTANVAYRRPRLAVA